MQKPVDNVDNESLAFPVTFVGPCVDASADSQPFFRHLLELKSTEEHYMSFFPPFLFQWIVLVHDVIGIE